MTNLFSQEFVLAVHPTAQGLGWAVFTASDALFDWGLVYARGGQSNRLLKRLEKLLAQYQPMVLVLEEYASEPKKRADRIQALIRAFEQLASRHSVPVVAYGREAVASALELPDRASRYDIACAVASRLDDLSHRLPPKRKFGDGEDARQALFAAAALAMTRYTVLGQA